MTRRWFVSSVSVGAANEATGLQGGRPALTPKVDLTKTIGAETERFEVSGPELQLLGPGDLVGFDRSLVVREEPPAGLPNAAAANLACVEFSDASLPWQFSRPAADGRTLPWIVLLVMREEKEGGEAKLDESGPLPVVRAAGAALPDLGDSWAWAHVEARVEDGAPSPREHVVAGVRSGSHEVISRLICPRRLGPESDWLACVVPATKAGVAAGFDPNAQVAQPFEAPWSAGQADAVRLPVYHFWRFSTGPEGSFEELARLVEPVKATEVPGFGARTVDVRRPWPHEDPLAGPEDPVTVSIQGALRIPGTETPEETWSKGEAQEAFKGKLRERLNAPAARFGTVSPNPDRDEKAVAPPLYGSHFSGEQEVPAGGWMASLNLQVRHRVAAALGCRYVQLEQEFLMARAWEQLGAINEANRLLAVGELSSEAASQAQEKHLMEMDPTEFTLLADPMRTAVRVEEAGTLEQTLEGSALPDGAASSAFKRLTRSGGGLDRRAARTRAATGGAMPETAPVLAEGLAGARLLPEAAAWVTAEAGDETAPVGADPASLPSSQALVGLLAGQGPLFEQRDEAALGQLTSAMAVATEAMEGATMTVAAPSPRFLRGLRRQLNAEPLVELPFVSAAVQMDVGAVAGSVRGQLQPFAKQLGRLADVIISPSLKLRDELEERPLRPIMEHPRFGMPIAAELLNRWPEWAIPGISGFPPNSATLLETNSPFVEAALVGLNQEFNRELLWREFPADQRGTAFTRFWPSEVDNPDVDEIARWSLDVELGEHDETGGKDVLVLLVRADVLRRFPNTTAHAAKSVGGLLPDQGTGEWEESKFKIPIDEQTIVYAFDLGEERAREEKWLFVLREPVHGTQFGFDTRTDLPLDTWADLTWDDVPVDRDFVVPRPRDGRPPTPGRLQGPDPAQWGRDSADVARIAFQRQFQLAFSPLRLLGEPR